MLKHKEPITEAPIIVKIMIPIDSKLKTIKTVRLFHSTGESILELAQLEMDEFKEDNEYLANMVKEVATFKVSL